jgi:hypothetical protein
MNTNKFKQAIIEDIEHLKHLEIEIIPATTYYTGLLKLLVGAFWKIGIILFLSILYVFLTYTDPHTSTTQAYWGVTRTSTFYIESALFIATGITLIALLVLIPAINNYFLIQYHFKDKLQTGTFLVKKLRGSGWLFLFALSIFSIMFSSYAEPNVMFFFEGIALILSAVVTCFVMNLEFNRLGLSILYTVIRCSFNGNKI